MTTLDSPSENKNRGQKIDLFCWCSNKIDQNLSHDEVDGDNCDYKHHRTGDTGYCDVYQLNVDCEENYQDASALIQHLPLKYEF